MESNANNQQLMKQRESMDATGKASIESFIYTVRGQQVMLDNDLAKLYEVETKVFNQAVKRNINRFPDRFRFQLTSDEYNDLRSQSVTSSRWGGRRYLPFAFTEQGIAMLSAVLKSDIAVAVSIQIMDAFVAMRRISSDHSMFYRKLCDLEARQAAFRESTDSRFEQVFHLLDKGQERSQSIFFEGQVFDAFALLIELVTKAAHDIQLVDNYVDVRTLNVLAKKRSAVNVRIYTAGGGLTREDIDTFNAQYPSLVVYRTRAFHDRFLILDGKVAYHIGASLKDAGRKCFAVSLLHDDEMVSSLVERLDEA